MRDSFHRKDIHRTTIVVIVDAGAIYLSIADDSTMIRCIADGGIDGELPLLR